VTVRIDQPSVAMNNMMKRSQIRFAFNPHSSPNKWFDIQELGRAKHWTLCLELRRFMKVP
jgi:hypothetical protein